MSEQPLLDRAGRRRSPATMPGFHAGRPPRNKGLRYPADPPKVEEIIAVMCAAGDDAHGRRLRGLIVILWRAGLRIKEALAVAESRSRSRRRLCPRGDGGRRRQVGMDAWGWEEAAALARAAPTGAGRAAVLRDQRPDTRTALVKRRSTSGPAQGRRPHAGVRRRFAPHQLRHAHAVELAREGVPLIVIQRQLGHSNLGITSVYLQRIDNAEISETVHARRQPMIPVSTSLPH